MTSPVGSIRLDLTIDGAGSLSKLQAQTKSVLGSVGSSAKAAGRDLDRLERDFDGAGRGAAKLTGPIASLAKAVDGLGDQYRQAAGSAEAFKVAQPSTRSLNAQARAVERLAGSYAKLSAAQAAASAVPPIQPPARGGGGGGFGGGGRGGGRGGLGGFLTGPVGLNALALGASALPPATLAVTNFTGAVQQLLQVGLAGPGVIGGLVTSVGTAALGFKGMGDAISALNEAAKSGDPKDLEKAAELLKDMDPAAVAVAKSVSKFTQGPLKDLRMGLQGKMFAGVDQAFDSLTEKRMPNLVKGTGLVGDAWNATLKKFAEVGGSDSTGSIMDRIFGNTAEGQQRANAAIEPLVKGIGTLTAAGTDFLPRLGDGLTKFTTRFSDFITKADGDGRLNKWIDQGLTGVGQLGNTFLNLGKSIASITQAAGGDGGLLKMLETGSTKLADFLGSAEGQEKLTRFFDDARARMAEWLPVLKDVASVAGDVFRGFQQWGDTILPVIGGIASALADMPDLVTGVVGAFLAFKTFSGLSSLIGSVTTLGGLLDGLPGKVNKAGAGNPGGGGLFGNRALAGAGLLAGGLTSQITGEANATNVLSTLAGGALAGSQFGPIGTVLGTLGAAAVSLTNVLLDQRNRLNTAKEALREFRENAPPLVPAINPNSPILPGTAVQPPNISSPNPMPGPTTVRGLLLGPAAGVGMGNGGEIRNTAGIDSALAGISDKAAVARANMDLLKTGIETLPTGEVVLKDNTPEAIERVKNLGYAVRDLPGGKIAIQVQYMLNGRPVSLDQLRAPIRVGAFPGDTTNPSLGGRASGGVLPGYSPGIDNLLVPMSGGEGVIIPEAMRALGGRWLYNLNSRFRAGLSSRGYADGGVVGGAGLGGDGTVIGLLTQIRDALVGKLAGPLSDTASGVDALSGGLTGGAGGTGVATFGGDMGKQFIAGIVNGFGGDSRSLFPEFGKNGLPIGFGAGGAGGLGGGNAAIAAALAKFATTGDTNDLTGSGLGAGDSVVSAIVTARNKKKNGLTDEEIAGLVNQVLGGGGYSGVLDDRNSALVKSLSTYGKKLSKAGGGAGVAASPLGMPTGGVGADPLISFAQAANGGQYKWGASDLAAGLADCSGAVSDLVELVTKGQADSGRLFSTADAASVLPGLGAVPGLVPGALQIGFSPTHMAATLPNGVNFESGGAGGGVRYGGDAAGAGDSQFTEQWSLPVGPLTDALGSMGQDMCGCIGDNIGDNMGGIGQLGKDLIGGIGGVAGTVGSDIAKGFGGSYKPSGPDADPVKLFKEGNPAALATLFGYKVPDLGRTGGGAAAQNLMVNPGPGFDAQGRMFSDTAVLIDRSMSSLQIVMESKFQQMQDVLNQIRDQLADIAGKLVSAAVQGGASTAAAAVPGAADGRVFPGYAPGVDSILARVSPGEGVLIPEAVRGLGGAAGVYAINSRFRRGLNRANYPGAGLPRFANGGVVSDTVGADFFGLSEIPIIGGIVNMLVSILLKILGIEIQSRDTLTNMSASVREFRGDFQRFDATGRLASDSSGLIDRNESGKDVVNAERIRILTQVIVGVIKYVIEKVIMPLINTAIQSAINFGTQAISSAVGMGVNAVAPGAGGVAGGITNAAVSALGSIAQTGGQIFTDFLGSFLTNGLTVLTEGIASLLPNMFGSLFDIPGLFKGLFGGVAGLLGGLVGGIGGLGGGFFDAGGLATNVGFMPKNTIKPERVLDPRQTVAFEEAMGRVGRGGSGRGDTHQKTNYVTQNFYGGGPDLGQQIADRIDALV